MTTLDNQIAEMKKIIFLLAIGIDKWRREPDKIPDSLYKGHLMLIKLLVGRVEKIPNNLYDLLEFLQLPFSSWNNEIIDKIFPEDEYFLEEDLSFSDIIVDLINEYDSPSEYELLPVKEFLLHCRENNLDSEYREVRTFLSKKENAVLKKEDLEFFFFAKFKNEKVKEFINKCYEPILQPIEHYRICPHCGWTLEKVNEQWTCNSHTVCNKLSDFNSLHMFDESFSHLPLVRMKPSIQRYVLIPGIQELKISKKLKKYKPVMYPNIDEFDIKIETNNKQINLDVKDVKHPIFLAKLFNQMDMHQLNKFITQNGYIIIPNYRFDLYGNYLTIVNSYLEPAYRVMIGEKFIKEGDIKKIVEEGEF